MYVDGWTCPVCNGLGNCPACDNRGVRTFRSCPKAEIPAVVWMCVEAYWYGKRGLWPINGGWLDQSASFLEAFRILHSEHESRRLERG
jgi:hypothetical protein